MRPTHDLSFATSLPSTPQSLQSHCSWRSEENGNLSSVTGFKAWRGRKIGGNEVCEFGGKQSGGGREFDLTGGEGEDSDGEGRKILMMAVVKAR
ncbi:hypothetical protein TIFTF001_002069 [Ficus carica]|uniref:Uncharacterized protein n=1 Tax=Ficus carica TaxID=3494 RepID=A0AA87Z901_FICCA|nr:hypothetical protein TIFTF001_002069 [Ficus carica]